MNPPQKNDIVPADRFREALYVLIIARGATATVGNVSHIA